MAKTRRFTLVAGSSNKFWEVAVDGDEVTVRYGRIGTDGQTKTKAHGSAQAAEKEAEKLIRQKTKKGYVEEGAARKGAPKKTATTATTSSSAKKSDGGIDELALFRTASFVKSSDYGEVRFLNAGDTPGLKEHADSSPYGSWLVHGDRIFVCGVECIEWSSTKKGKWTKVPTKLSVGGLTPLDDGRVAFFGDKYNKQETQVLVLEPRGASYRARKLGTLAVHRGVRDPVAAQQGDSLVVIGGADPGTEKPFPPEVVNLKTGRSRVVG